jgi:uncharacterized membrane protein
MRYSADGANGGAGSPADGHLQRGRRGAEPRPDWRPERRAVRHRDDDHRPRDPGAACRPAHERGSRRRPRRAGPRFLTYILSFLTLGIFWNAQHTQLNYVGRADRHYAWLQLAYLAVIALLPFSTSLLAEFIDVHLAFGVYWLNLLALGVMLYVLWVYAERAGLIETGTTPEISRALKQRIVNYQALYFLGFLLSLPLGTIPGIVFVVLVELNSAIAPKLPILSRL